MNFDAQEMRQLFTRSGIALTKEQETAFTLFYDLLVRYNDEYDLSRLKKFDDIIIKHFIDSIYAGKLIKLPSPLVDIGTGAGFPGIPLKIMNPGLHIILAEPRHKRVTFMEMAIKELKLTNIEIYPHLVTDKSFFTVNGVITRALESVDETLTRVNHFLPQDGRVIFMKGPDASSDLQTLSEANSREYTTVANTPYTLPGTDYRRVLLAFSKTGESLKRTFRILKDERETIGKAITSSDNPRFKALCKITGTDGIKKLGKTLIAGKKIIKEILAQAEVPTHELVLYDGYAEHDQEFERIISDHAQRGSLLILKKSLYNEIDSLKSNGPLLSADVPAIHDWDLTVPEGCSLMLPFQDPENIGSVIRSAAGFGVKIVILLKEASHPFHPKAIRASAGAVFSLRISRGPSINDIAGLPAEIVEKIVTLDRHGKNIEDCSFPESFIILPGIEGPGVPENLKSMAVSIPLNGAVESLNASAATSIALYEWRRRLKKNMNQN